MLSRPRQPLDKLQTSWLRRRPDILETTRVPAPRPLQRARSTQWSEMACLSSGRRAGPARPVAAAHLGRPLHRVVVTLFVHQESGCGGDKADFVSET